MGPLHSYLPTTTMALESALQYVPPRPYSLRLLLTTYSFHSNRDSGSHYDYDYNEDGASTSSNAYSGYGEEDHRRLLFGLMRGGFNSKVELALRYIGEGGAIARSSATGSIANSYPASDDEGSDDDDDINSVDSAIDNTYSYPYNGEEEDDEEDEDLPEEMEESPALTTRPLSYNMRKLSLSQPRAGAMVNEDNNDERAGGGGAPRGWAWAKNDEQQRNAALHHLHHRDEGYVHEWVADQRLGVAELV